MERLNSKGIISFTALVLWMVGGSTVSAMLGVDSFRTKKALEYCNKEGIYDCKSVVSAMSKPEVLAYIKDTQEQPR